MRLGRDMFVFTKRGSERTLIMLSRTFLIEEDITDRVVVPSPSWGDGMTPLIDNDAGNTRELV